MTLNGDIGLSDSDAQPETLQASIGLQLSGTIYQGGSIYDTPFWNHAKKISKDRLNNDLMWQLQINDIKMNKKENYRTMRNCGVGVLPVKSWVDFDDNLKYNMF